MRSTDWYPHLSIYPTLSLLCYLPSRVILLVQPSLSLSRRCWIGTVITTNSRRLFRGYYHALLIAVTVICFLFKSIHWFALFVLLLLLFSLRNSVERKDTVSFSLFFLLSNPSHCPYVALCVYQSTILSSPQSLNLAIIALARCELT